MAEPVAIFGGTFDPVHRAHLGCALRVSRLFDHCPVHLLPNSVPPHRPQPRASGAHRLAMLRLACAPFPRLQPDDWELNRPGPSWTLATLEHFRASFPASPLMLVIGADSLASLDTWHRWREYARLCHLVVLGRPGVPAPGLSVRLRFPPGSRRQLLGRAAGLRLDLPVPALDLSSTRVRQAPDSPAGAAALPVAVRDHIRRHGLYNDPASVPGGGAAGTRDIS